MVSDQILSPVAFDHAPASLVDALDAEHLPGGHAAEQRDQRRIDCLDLLDEVIGHAGFYFAHSGRAVVRGPAFDDVGDEEVVAVDARAFEHLIEEAAGGADEWAPALIFFAARGLADQHDPGRSL